MKLFKKLGIAIAALSLTVTSAMAVYTQPLGGSIFPLTFVTQPVTNLADSYNQMLALINAQVVGISTQYAGTLLEPASGVDTTQAAFSATLMGNPLVLGSYTDILVSTSLTSTANTTLIASAAGRTIYPIGGAVTIMVSGTAASATGIALECSDGTLLASWPIADLITLKPIGIGLYTSASAADGTITTGPALTKGCTASTALQISNIGTNLTTTTHVYVNIPYTVQ